MSTDLPPEAYTKETLQAAFDWLQTQPDVVRASVHTPERLVSLFQRAQRLNDHDHPVSSKKFVSDLKNLASSLDQFSGKPQTLEVKPQMNPPIPPSTPSSTFEPSGDALFENRSQTTTQTVKKASFEVTTNTQQTQTSRLEMDTHTTERVQKVRARLNLSSDHEALRVLVSLGYEKFEQIP